MKKLYALLLIFAFAACYLPAVQVLCKIDSATCVVNLDEEKDTDTKKNDKKELKDLLEHIKDTLLAARVMFSYGHDSHFLGDNPAADVLTPPPNFG
jgi:hypothetical protein